MVKFGIGQPVTRLEDRRLLTGTGSFTDDRRIADAAHAFILRSPHAHATIRAIDTEAAAAAPGVLSVLTGADVEADGLGPIKCGIELENRDGSQRADTNWPILARELVRHVGDPVALIVAETLAAARDAAERIEIDYEELPASVDTVGAAQDGAPRVWDAMDHNICFDWGEGDASAVDAALAEAAEIVELELVNNRLFAGPMEPRAALAEYEPGSGRTTLHTSSQSVHFLLDRLAEDIFRVDPKELRVVTGDVGGGFGMKIFLHPEQPLVVWAARRLRRSVRWTGERSEGFISDVQGRDNVTVARLAIDGQGLFTGLKVTTHANMGAYLSHFAPFVATGAGVAMLAGLYKTPAIYVNVLGVATHTVPVDAYRGAGRPEAIYVIERLVDKAARQLGVAPDELRRRNFIRPEDLPYETPMASVYDSGDFPAVMDESMGRADWAGFAARRAAAAEAGRLRGIGMVSYVEKCGGGSSETARVAFGEDEDTITIHIGTQSNGQGHETAYVQIMADRLGIDAEHIVVVQGDSDRVPPGLTGGSRSVTVGGAAVGFVSEAIIDKGRGVAAQILETAAADIVYDQGVFTVAGTDRAMSLFEVARAARRPENLPDGTSPGLDESYEHEPSAPTFPNGCHICEVEVDPNTGDVEIVAYTAVDDFGDVINPLLLAGQVHGGIVQGVGQALLEHVRYDDESGQILTGSFMDYAMPRAIDMPEIAFSMLNFACTTNPMGIKGSGEAGAIGAPPAVINAVVDALEPRLGPIDIDMPATPAYLWSLLHGAHGG